MTPAEREVYRAKVSNNKATATDYVPEPKQATFLRLSCFEVLFGGSAGGGKSDALLAGAFAQVTNKHHRALLLRREYPELQRTLIARSFELYPSLGATGFREKTKTWYFPSGARIEFGHAENEKDIEKYDGSAYNYIGIDEANHWTAKMYRFLISRCRSAYGLPLRFRATANPGGVGHDMILQRFAPWLYPVGIEDYTGQRAKSAEVLYFLPREGRVDAEDIVPRETEGAVGRCFVQSQVRDNSYLAGTDYEKQLALLDPLTRAQKRDGDWMARPGARVFFKREHFKIVEREDVSPDAVLCRYWDRAATEDPKADWTVGLLLAYSRARGVWWILDVVRGQWEPAEVERQIKRQIAIDNPRGVRTVLERDPAAAGKFEAAYYLRELAGNDVHATAPAGSKGQNSSVKITRAKPVSAQAEAGNIRVVRGAWNRAVLDVLEGFPEGHDDDVDALSGAFRQTLLIGSSTGARHGGQRTDVGSNILRSGGY